MPAYNLPPLRDAMSRALAARDRPDPAALIMSRLKGPPQDMTSPEAQPWIRAMNPGPEFDHTTCSKPRPATEEGTPDAKDTLPPDTEQRSLDQLQMNAGRLRFKEGLIQRQKNDLDDANKRYTVSLNRLKKGVTTREVPDALWDYQDSKADMDSRQDEMEWSKHELKEARARHEDHQRWHDQTFTKAPPPVDQAALLSAKAASVPTPATATSSPTSPSLPATTPTPDSTTGTDRFGEPHEYPTIPSELPGLAPSPAATTPPPAHVTPPPTVENSRDRTPPIMLHRDEKGNGIGIRTDLNQVGKDIKEPLEAIGSLVPIVSAGQDVKTVFDPNAKWWERGIAGVSLGATIATEGVVSGIGKVLKGGKTAVKEGGVVVKAAEDVAKGGKSAIHQHHSDPKFMGGDPKQKLTPIPEKEHQALHKDLNEHLVQKTDAAGNHMRPQRGNSGPKIQRNFSIDQLRDAAAEFYKKTMEKYPQVAKDFFDQHPGRK